MEGQLWDYKAGTSLFEAEGLTVAALQRWLEIIGEVKIKCTFVLVLSALCWLLQPFRNGSAVKYPLNRYSIDISVIKWLFRCGRTFDDRVDNDRKTERESVCELCMATGMHVCKWELYSEECRQVMKRRNPGTELWGMPDITEDGRDLIWRLIWRLNLQSANNLTCWFFEAPDRLSLRQVCKLPLIYDGLASPSHLMGCLGL